MGQCDKEHQCRAYYGRGESRQEFTPFQVSRPVAFSTRQQDGEYIEHHNTSGIDHDLYRSEESIPQQKVDACCAEKHKQQIGGRTYDALCSHRQYGHGNDEHCQKVEYYCFKCKSHILLFFFLFDYFTAFVIELQDELAPVEYGMLKYLVEGDCVVRAGIDT